MNWEHVLLEKQDHIATITLNRPDRSNAFGGLMRQEILAALEDVAADKDTRVVVITGAGKAFCTGGDVDEFASGQTKALSLTMSNERHAMCRAVLAINSMEKPVIASVNGIAAGGGCNLALARRTSIAGTLPRRSTMRPMCLASPCRAKISSKVSGPFSKNGSPSSRDAEGLTLAAACTSP